MIFDHNIDNTRIHVVATQTTTFYLYIPDFSRNAARLQGKYCIIS
jgi:hypothetical protein